MNGPIDDSQMKRTEFVLCLGIVCALSAAFTLALMTWGRVVAITAAGMLIVALLLAEKERFRDNAQRPRSEVEPATVRVLCRGLCCLPVNHAGPCLSDYERLS